MLVCLLQWFILKRKGADAQVRPNEVTGLPPLFLAQPFHFLLRKHERQDGA